ncbi:DUF1697 domain-containing protein [Alkalicoccus luteus]|uniref:DUF1697 domain-containing protein n=1 Tax=Alkalicoccus luteus TaxID=1237094 RepID=A0A969PQT4_9BACI|nr:DUF1697 domain-containing protein [Alkalicoccus luteus]NJP36258.1 DUF1697 domain-containing protein [Alkalicoccus luteus]
MMYAALLRGINVGGKNKVDMLSLKEIVEAEGMTKVETYLNTGNVIFSHDGKPVHTITQRLETVINDAFGLKLKLLIRSLPDMSTIIEALPDSWQNNQDMKSDVLFPWESIDDASILDQLPVHPEVDSVVYVPGAVLWSADRKNVKKSGLSKLAGTKWYKQMTIRNVNITRKIYKMMVQAENN